MENVINSNEADVLMVEDSQSDAELISRALSKLNTTSKVYWVKDGEEALAFLFHTGKYASRDDSIPLKVIFLDLKLPKVAGLEVLATIKSDTRTKMIPVVVVTSSQEDTDIAEAYTHGANSYIVKPIAAEHFIQTVSTAGLYWLVLNQPFVVE